MVRAGRIPSPPALSQIMLMYSIISSADYNVNGAILYEYTADRQVRRAAVSTDHTVFCDWQGAFTIKIF